jgi:cell division protein FtsW
MTAIPVSAAVPRLAPRAEGAVDVSAARTLFVALAAVLASFGLLMVHSASITARPTDFEQVYLSRHMVFLGLGVAAAVVVARIPRESWQRLAPWLFVATLVLLVLVLVPGLGTRVKGAQRWFRVGGISVQPSEIAKVTLPLFMAALVQARRHRLGHWWGGTVPLLWPVLLVVPPVLLQPDLGTSLFLLSGAGLVLFAGGWPIRNFVAGLSLAIPGLVYVILHKPYQLRRVTGFLETWADWTTAPYQLKQSLVTLGTGGLWGVGLGRGYQKLSFLPEANTDFVFAVIGEELGLIGTLSVLGLWAGLFVCGLRMLSVLPRDGFAFLAGFPLLTQLLAQACVNICVVTAMVPPKGIPHPLLSYGGSNLVMSLVTLGLICGLTSPPAEPRGASGTTEPP